MEKIALLPGGFKPPHAGHYNMAKWLVANTDADIVLVRVGSKERDGITRDMSLVIPSLSFEPILITTESASVFAANHLAIL